MHHPNMRKGESEGRKREVPHPTQRVPREELGADVSDKPGGKVVDKVSAPVGNAEAPN